MRKNEGSMQKGLDNIGVVHKYLVIYFQVSAYEEQLFPFEPQMNADGLSAADSFAFIRGLWKLFSPEKIPENFC